MLVSESPCACQRSPPSPDAIRVRARRLKSPNLASADRTRPSTDRYAQIALPGLGVSRPSSSSAVRCESHSGLKSTYSWWERITTDRISGSGRSRNLRNVSRSFSLCTSNSGARSSPRTSMFVPERCTPTRNTGTALGEASCERRHRAFRIAFGSRANGSSSSSSIRRPTPWVRAQPRCRRILVVTHLGHEADERSKSSGRRCELTWSLLVPQRLARSPKVRAVVPGR